MGDCQNYGPFLGPDYNTGPNTGPNLGDPKRDHNFDNPPCDLVRLVLGCCQGTASKSLQEGNHSKGHIYIYIYIRLW